MGNDTTSTCVNVHRFTQVRTTHNWERTIYCTHTWISIHVSPFKYFSYIEQIIDIPSKTDIHRLYTLCKFGCLISSNRFNMFVAENTKHWPRQCQTLWITQYCFLIHYYRLWHLQCKNVSHVNWITQITKHAIIL